MNALEQLAATALHQMADDPLVLHSFSRILNAVISERCGAQPASGQTFGDLLRQHRWTCGLTQEELAERASVPFMVHENFRFQPWYREIKRLVDRETIGDRLHGLYVRTRTGDGYGDNAYLNRQPYFRQMPRLLIHETGVHFIDGLFSAVDPGRNFNPGKVVVK